MRRSVLLFAAANLALGVESVAACDAEKVFQTAALPPPANEATAPARPEKLPPIESLTADSDYTLFMQPGVDKALQAAALRKLWRLHPAFSRSDGLDSYSQVNP